jgi:dCMP deaminase
VEKNTDWHNYFLEIAKFISTKSKDPSTKCGAVIVRPDNTICSTGFNGFSQYTEDKKEYYEDRGEKYHRIIHAEMNAILFARENLSGYTIYCHPGSPWLASCDNCTKHIIQSGIRKIVFRGCDEDDFHKRWKDSCMKSLKMAEEAGMEIIKI